MTATPGANQPEDRLTWSAQELQQIVRTEHLGLPFIVWRDGVGGLQILGLAPYAQVVVGRHASNHVVLDVDSEVSRTHAQIELVGADWTIIDDGLSRNGTFVNGTRLNGRWRLRDRDRLRFGRTVVEYRCPADIADPTAAGVVSASVDTLTPTQHRILVALCRPYKDGGAFATPASNNEIAAEVFLGVDAVKNHLRLLFQRFGIADLAQNQKRARLLEVAMQSGLVSEREL